MNELKLAALVFAAVLNGMKTVYGVEIYKEKEEPFWKVWNCRWLYVCGAVSLGVFALIYCDMSDNLVFNSPYRITKWR